MVEYGHHDNSKKVKEKKKGWLGTLFRRWVHEQTLDSKQSS